MKNELISIIIPVYNNEKWFERCISSVINQTYKNIEIIIINDCSLDNVESIIKKYEALDKRIVYLKNDKNIGVGYSRNKGIEISKGNYIYFLDSDDYIEKDTIETLYRNIKPSDIYCSMLAAYKEINGVKQEAHRKIEDLELLKSPSVCIRLFNKKLIKESNIKFSDIKIGEDLEFIFKLIIFNDTASYVDKILYTYVVHDDSTIRSNTDNQLDTLKAIDHIVEYAKEINKYEEFKERIEYAAVEHILVGTISRILKINNYSKADIQKCITYINNNYPNWKANKYVQSRIFTNDKIVARFKELGIF